ncbi:MAG: thiol:disulfide interchange protein DsbA/DsbL [Gammaproteobacteria bacterium]|jgi:thiol:disulfide interchange protein DsbA
MKTVSRWLLILLIPFYALTACAAENMAEGREYEKLSSPQPTSSGDRIEVVELFWYGCPHCYHLEPYVENWLRDKPEDVEFMRMPAILGASWELLAKGYYTAELLGVLDKIHSALFETIHEQKTKINKESALRDFFVKQGVPAADFDKTFNSFAVNVKVNNARLMTRRYAITGVPTLIVNGKYRTGPGMLSNGNDGVMGVVDYLIAQERAVAAAHAAR